MITWEPMELADIHKGTTGYVEFKVDGLCAMILCEVLDISSRRENWIEITPVASNRSCLWIQANKICQQIWS